MRTYQVIVRHYDEPTQAIQTPFKRKDDALRYMRQQGAILETCGYPVWETADGELKAYNKKADRTETTFWVRSING